MKARCDFCQGRPVTKEYRAIDFVSHTASVPGITAISESDWAACAKCAKLIDAGEWDAMIRRGEARLVQKNKFVRDLPRAQVKEYVTKFYAEFRKAWLDNPEEKP